MNLMKKRQKDTNLKVYKITMKKLKRKVKGITLIALVVTVIVLLILAGVAINLTVGDNGLFKRAQNAADTYQDASEREAIELALAGMQIGSMQETGMTKAELENSLKEQFGDEASVEENEDGSFIVTIGENKYYIGDDGGIIDSSNMVEISSVEELKAFRDDVNSGNTYEGKYVYLTNDITLDSNEEWEPIGYYSQDTESIRNVLENEKNKPFSGIFDGKGHTINNMYINTTNIVQGLFGLVINGEIKNINIAENCSINTGNISGSVVGYMYNTGKISGCKNYANLNQVRGGIVGGIAGSITVSNCINYGDIQNAAGGIVGSSNGTDWNEFEGKYHRITNCANYGNISRNENLAGGIVGYFKGNILNCFNNGEINTTVGAVGGIVGAITGKVQNCYNTKMVKGDRVVGGIVGDLERAYHNLIENCYNIGNVTGVNGNVGEIFGRNTDNMLEIVNCYNSSDTFSASDLGAEFEEDTENINQGYPILKWQKNINNNI